MHWRSAFWRQVGEKFIQTFLSSFPRFLPVFMSVIPWVSSYGGVWNPQGSSHIYISVKLDLFRCPARDRKSPLQRRTTLNIFGKEVDLGKSVPQTACLSSEVNKYTAELSFGSSSNTLSARAHTSTEICIELFTRRRDRQRSFSISLKFYQTFLESRPQTRFMFDIKKLL